ncbi:NUDIX domain-containing protein [Microbacterium sp. SORGH_AS_0888]|uniref:NUDIX domain-containing protein n=1 Tax=Microbacterium sp. SORGH_AS_0888 TaxID=3041791 RepID=UPI002788A3D4|nr:NUDIX domain-containing protein [Microbacterium sp. SORGH_AS_0888]MDQ1129507.1 putative NUDIX family NTP pyrophosphohydrolase [Microbacterium sp. SORGH_AS_0888]
MVVTSSGLLLHRAGGREVLIAHMGGPFWARKDVGAWSIPKGEYDPAEETAEQAAVREFREELGVDPPSSGLRPLGVFRYASGKRLSVFAVEASDWRHPPFAFGSFELEWPPGSGVRRRFPEVDRAEWMSVAAAGPLLVAAQRPALEALAAT